MLCLWTRCRDVIFLYCVPHQMLKKPSFNPRFYKQQSTSARPCPASPPSPLIGFLQLLCSSTSSFVMFSCFRSQTRDVSVISGTSAMSERSYINAYFLARGLIFLSFLWLKNIFRGIFEKNYAINAAIFSGLLEGYLLLSKEWLIE